VIRISIRFIVGCMLALVTGWAVAASVQPADIEVFVREGCPHCAEAKVFLARLQQE